MFKNTGSQKLTVLAFADAGHASLDAGDRVTGDAANITCKIEQDDDGTQSASNDTNPSEVEDGQYRFDLTQAETNGDKLTFYPESSTAGVQVVALPSNVIYTRPPNFPAMGIETDGHVHGDVKEIEGVDATDQINAACDTALSDYDGPTNAEMEARTLVAANYGTASNQVTIESKIDTVDGIVDNILTDTATTIPGLISGLNDLSTGDIDTRLAAIGLDHLVSAAVVGADVTDNSIVAKLVSASATADWDDFVNTTDSLQAVRDRGDSAWITATGFSTHTAANVRTEMDANSTQLAAIVADTNELQGDWTNGGRLDLIIDAILVDTGTTLDSKIDTIDTNVDSILADTGTDGVVVAAGSKTGYSLASTGLDLVVPADPSAIPVLGTASVVTWIGYFGAWTVNEVNSDSDSVDLRNSGDTANLTTHATSDDGTTFVSGAAT